MAELGRSGVRPLLLVDVGSGGAGNDDTNKRAGAHLLCLARWLVDGGSSVALLVLAQ
jgi:hypothetical protein